jgi:hypothetical protein
MATKKKGAVRKRPVAETLEAEDTQAQESEPEAAIGPSETTQDKGADEIWWRCPHCSTKYAKGEEIMRRNHLARVHNITAE